MVLPTFFGPPHMCAVCVDFKDRAHNPLPFLTNWNIIYDISAISCQCLLDPTSTIWNFATPATTRPHTKKVPPCDQATYRPGWCWAQLDAVSKFLILTSHWKEASKVHWLRDFHNLQLQPVLPLALTVALMYFVFCVLYFVICIVCFRFCWYNLSPGFDSCPAWPNFGDFVQQCNSGDDPIH